MRGRLWNFSTNRYTLWEHDPSGDARDGGERAAASSGASEAASPHEQEAEALSDGVEPAALAPPADAAHQRGELMAALGMQGPAAGESNAGEGGGQAWPQQPVGGAPDAGSETDDDDGVTAAVVRTQAMVAEIASMWRDYVM